MWADWEAFAQWQKWEWHCGVSFRIRIYAHKARVNTITGKKKRNRREQIALTDIQSHYAINLNKSRLFGSEKKCVGKVTECMFLYSFESIQLKESQNEIKMPYIENASEWILSILLRIGSVLISTIWRLLLWFTWKMGRAIDTIQIFFFSRHVHIVCVHLAYKRQKWGEEKTTTNQWGC